MHPPRHVDDITPAWLSAVLQERYPGSVVGTVAVTDHVELTNSHCRLRVTYAQDGGAPTRLFCKLLPSGSRREAVAKTGMGPKEVLFYRDLAPRLQLRVPQVAASLHDETDDSFVLLMEDLLETNCVASDGTWALNVDQAAGALIQLAELHARYEDPARRSAEAGWVRAPVFGSTYGSTMLQLALDHHRERLSDDFAALSNMYINNGKVLFDLWTTGPKTIIHGDTHIGNLFFDGATVGFLDWGLIAVHTPMREVSYLLNMAMDTNERRKGERDLLRLYLDARTSFGASEISADAAWMAHRLHAAYCVVASCQIVTFPEKTSPERKVFSDAFLARAEAAIGDLASYEAVCHLAESNGVRP